MSIVKNSLKVEAEATEVEVKIKVESLKT